MKGFVKRVFAQEEYLAIKSLAKRLSEFDSLDKHSKFKIVSKPTKNWFGFRSVYNYPVANCPKELEPFYYYYFFDDTYYFCKLAGKGKLLLNLADLVEVRGEVYLSEDLCNLLNFLKSKGYV